MEFHIDGAAGLIKDKMLELLRKATKFENLSPDMVKVEATDEAVIITFKDNQIFDSNAAALITARAGWGATSSGKGFAVAMLTTNPERTLAALSSPLFGQLLRKELQGAVTSRSGRS